MSEFDRGEGERAAAPPSDSSPPRSTTPAPLDTRRYGWAVGVLAAALVAGFLLYTLTSPNSSGTAGVPAGGRLHLFAAPLAASTLGGDANLNPPCTPAHHDQRALNVCLLVKRGPLVLAFFVTNSRACVREVDTLQALAARPAVRDVQFAAVAVNGTHGAVAKLVRAHRWAIPVAYDADGAVGGVYGVSVCPLLELADRGGAVAARLIGEHWINASALAARVGALARTNASG